MKYFYPEEIKKKILSHQWENELWKDEAEIMKIRDGAETEVLYDEKPTINLPDDLLSIIVKKAEEKGLSYQDYVVQLLKKELHIDS